VAIVAAAIAPASADAETTVYRLTPTRALPCANRALAPTARDGAAIARATVCLINLQRRRHRLPALRVNRSLEQVARRQSAEMIRGDYFGDNSISGRSPLQRILPALARTASAELSTAQNIGWGTGSFATPAGMVSAWMHSPPHRRALLRRSFREAGVGVTASLPKMLSLGSNGAIYVLELAALTG
jgi:uncharacterized protein YkwD